MFVHSISTQTMAKVNNEQEKMRSTVVFGNSSSNNLSFVYCLEFGIIVVILQNETLKTEFDINV